MPDLIVTCRNRKGRWHDPDPSARGETIEERNERWRWTGAVYEQ
jgi:hypothetical protein